MFDIDKGFIFTHPEKCGGTSIEFLLGFFNLTKDQQGCKHNSLSEHISMIDKFGYSSEDFFKFSIIRNPWDRMVSYFYHDTHIQIKNFIKWNPNKPLPNYLSKISQMSFKEYVVFRCQCMLDKNFSVKKYMFHQDKFSLDYCIKFENIVEDTKIVMKKLGIEYEILPHKNDSFEYKPQIHYSEYYSEETMELVASSFIEDIELFEYDFKR